MIAVGNAAGQSAGGGLVQQYGYRAAFLGSATCVLLLAVLAWARRRSLTPPGRDQRTPRTISTTASVEATRSTAISRYSGEVDQR